MINADWNDIYIRSKEQGKKDAGTYKIAAYVLAVLAVVFLFIFTLASAMFICMALLSLYFRYRNLKGDFLIFDTKITDKFETKKILYSEPGEDDVINITQHFKISVLSVSGLGANGPVKISRNYSEFKQMIVPENVYNLFKVNDAFSFILTPAYDLYAYCNNGEIVILPQTLAVK